MDKKGFKAVLVIQHLMLLLYSTSSMLSKLAAGEPFLSPLFCRYYGGAVTLLGIYALGWQQILKRLPLATAYANKAITVVWGMFWGAILFQEEITPGKVLGALLVISGVVAFARTEGRKCDE